MIRDVTNVFPTGRWRGKHATTWSARTWTSFTMQRISCALMVAVAWELAGAMGLASVGDTRDDDE